MIRFEKISKAQAIIWAPGPDADERRLKMAQHLKDIKSPKAPKLTDEEVREIRIMLKKHCPALVATTYNVSIPLIHAIKNGRTYKRVKDYE